MALTVRIKSKNGQHVINQLMGTSSLGDLKSKLTELTSIDRCALKILHGFPPKVMQIRDDNCTLNDLSLKSGDTLIVEEDAAAKARADEEKTQQLIRELQNQMDSNQGILTREVVPANNSCLFTSVNFVMEGGKLDLSSAQPMRELIAGVVMSDPDTYCDAFLGKSNATYCSWIMNDESWGGAIEVSILSKYFGVEIDVVDTQYQNINRFGEDQNYPKRVLLIYDGIHYDPLKYESLDGGPVQTIFSRDNEDILVKALELASEAKASRQFTDVKGFSLRCLICQKCLTGQVEAQAHAKTTGHINFGEV